MPPHARLAYSGCLTPAWRLAPQVVGVASKALLFLLPAAGGPSSRWVTVPIIAQLRPLAAPLWVCHQRQPAPAASERCAHHRGPADP